jgi:hypothetical protein
MNVTLRSLAYLFIDSVSGGNRTSDSRLDPQDVILRIRQLMNEVMALKYYEKYQDGDKSPISLYVSTYTLTMQHDTNLNRAYVTLPQFYATLSNNRGIHEIWRKEFPDQSIIITQQPRVSRNLRAGNVADIVYAYVEGLNVIFRNIAVEPDDEPEDIVLQIIVAAPDSIGINDTLPIVAEQQAEIMRRLLAMYKPEPVDLAVNNNPNV